jgi:hypothetical protein
MSAIYIFPKAKTKHLMLNSIMSKKKKMLNSIKHKFKT